MRNSATVVLIWVAALSARAEIKPAAFDLTAIRDGSTLDTRVVEDWKPAARETVDSAKN
jgi:hypothetical protein